MSLFNAYLGLDQKETKQFSSFLLYTISRCFYFSFLIHSPIGVQDLPWMTGRIFVVESRSLSFLREWTHKAHWILMRATLCGNKKPIFLSKTDSPLLISSFLLWLKGFLFLWVVHSAKLLLSVSKSSWFQQLSGKRHFSPFSLFLLLLLLPFP